MDIDSIKFCDQICKEGLVHNYFKYLANAVYLENAWCNFYYYSYYNYSYSSNDDIQPSTLITNQSPSGLLLWKKSVYKS